MVANQQVYNTVFTAWHRVSGVKLHPSLNHILCHPEFSPQKYRHGHPADHNKLLQLETGAFLGAAVWGGQWGGHAHAYLGAAIILDNIMHDERCNLAPSTRCYAVNTAIM